MDSDAEDDDEPGSLTDPELGNATPGEPEANPAIRERLRVSATGEGPLSDGRFAAKDVFSVAGHTNAAGNPDWLRTHAPAQSHAPVVAQLLAAGAELVAVTHMDELAYSLAGDNPHYGAPHNPAAPGCLAGGSSSGSASLVAAAEVDFALGTDTGGSIRVPASYCGIFGIRPTHGAISTEGVVPLAPSFDTVGWFARDSRMLRDVGQVLLPASAGGMTSPGRLLVAEDLIARLPESLRERFTQETEALAKQFGLTCEPANFAVADPEAWADAFVTLQGAEVHMVHGGWVREASPVLGEGVQERMTRAAELKADLPRQRAAAALREALREDTSKLLAPGTVLALPSAAGPAPPIAPLEPADADDGAGAIEVTPPGDLRQRTLEVTCLASLTGIPQVSLPALTHEKCPVGLSVAAAAGCDDLLLRMALRWSCA